MDRKKIKRERILIPALIIITTLLLVFISSAPIKISPKESTPKGVSFSHGTQKGFDFVLEKVSPYVDVKAGLADDNQTIQLNFTAKKTIPTGYIWDIAYCDLQNEPSLTIKIIRDVAIPGTGGGKTTIQKSTVNSKQGRSSWCKETNGEGYYLSEDLSKLHLPQSFKINISDPNFDFKLYFGNGTGIAKISSTISTLIIQADGSYKFRQSKGDYNSEAIDSFVDLSPLGDGSSELLSRIAPVYAPGSIGLYGISSSNGMEDGMVISSFSPTLTQVLSRGSTTDWDEIKMYYSYYPTGKVYIYTNSHRNSASSSFSYSYTPYYGFRPTGGSEFSTQLGDYTSGIGLDDDWGCLINSSIKFGSSSQSSICFAVYNMSSPDLLYSGVSDQILYLKENSKTIQAGDWSNDTMLFRVNNPEFNDSSVNSDVQTTIVNDFQFPMNYTKNITGSWLTNKQGDEDNDGFAEGFGAYQIQASGTTAKIEFGTTDVNRYQPAIWVYGMNNDSSEVTLKNSSGTYTLTKDKNYYLSNYNSQPSKQILVLSLNLTFTTDTNITISGANLPNPCSGGLCVLDYHYISNELYYISSEMAIFPKDAVQFEWDLSSLKELGLTGGDITSVNLSLYIEAIGSTADSDSRIGYVNDTWSAGSLSGPQFYDQAETNLTTKTFSPFTASQMNNISVFKQVQQGLNSHDVTTIRMQDPDGLISTDSFSDNVTISGSPLIQSGGGSIFPTSQDYSIDFTGKTGTLANRPVLYISYNLPSPQVNNEFVPPTPVANYTPYNHINFTMQLNETCNTGSDALKVKIDSTNYSVCTSCPASPPGNITKNVTGLSDGNHTVSFWCNQKEYDPTWIVTEDGSGNTVTIESPSDTKHFALSTDTQINCSAYAPSGVTGLKLYGDFGNTRFNLSLKNSTTFDGTSTNVSYNFTIPSISVNDSYQYYCEATSSAGNKKNSSTNTISIGKAKVYLVYSIDTESNNRPTQDGNYTMNLSFINYANDGVSAADETFNQTWRNTNNGTDNVPPKITWYMMTHEGHCHAYDAEGVLDNPVGCNIIADIMYGNTTYYSSGYYYRNKVESFGDDYGWHNHQSYWNGTTETDPSGFWEGQNNFVFDPSIDVFYNNQYNESSVVRAEKLVAQFAYDNALPWSSYRAGWLLTNTLYREFLANNTALDFGRLPTTSGNMWDITREDFGYSILNRFRCTSGSPSQSQVDNAFQYANNQTSVVICGYSHNYGAAPIKGNIDTMMNRVGTASTTYPNVQYEWKTSKEAAQEYFRITDTTAPQITISVSGDNVIADFNEPLYMKPALTILVNNGTTTNYTLHYMEKVTDTQYKFNKSSWADVAVGYRVRATDKGFNVNTSSFLESNINIVQPTSSSPVSVSGGENITIKFKFYVIGTEKTTGVTLSNLTISNLTNTYECTQVGTFGYVGGSWQQNCTVPNGLNDNWDLNVFATHPESPELTSTETNAIAYPPSDSCTYGGSGDWIIQCSDSCIINTLTDVGGNNLIFNGSGVAMVQSKIYNFAKFRAIGESSSNKCRIRWFA